MKTSHRLALNPFYRDRLFADMQRVAAAKGVTMSEASQDASKLYGEIGIRLEWERGAVAHIAHIIAHSWEDLWKQVNDKLLEIEKERMGAEHYAQKQALDRHELHDLLIAHTKLHPTAQDTCDEVLKWAARLTKHETIELGSRIINAGIAA